MANGTGISWPYNDGAPHLNICLMNRSGKQYPLDDEKSVLIDTGYAGELLLQKKIYEKLELDRWEEPEPDEFKLADGSKVELLVSKGLILIPKLKQTHFDVRIHRFEKKLDSHKMLIGSKFIIR